MRRRRGQCDIGSDHKSIANATSDLTTDPLANELSDDFMNKGDVNHLHCLKGHAICMVYSL